MLTTLIHTVVHTVASSLTYGIAASSLALSAVFGPPHIVVTPMATTANASGVPVFTIEAGHHSDRDQLTVTGRAESMQNGTRRSLPLTLVRTGDGRYSVSKQWDDGAAWVLVFAAEQGPRGTHGVAEAVVRIDARGGVAGITYPTPGWVAPGNSPKRTTQREIETSLATLVARR